MITATEVLLHAVMTLASHSALVLRAKRALELLQWSPDARLASLDPGLHAYLQREPAGRGGQLECWMRRWPGAVRAALD